MIQPLTPIEINSVRAIIAKGASAQRSISWGDIRYAKKGAPNTLRETGSFKTGEEPDSRAIMDTDGIRFYDATNTKTADFKTSDGTITITGTITASGGTIGGWTIGATSLLSGTGANTRAIDSGGTNPAFYAGSATPGSAPFRVSAAGALVATNATITGAITATSGTFSGSLSGATGTFSGSLSGATGTFSGSLSAATGTFSGSLSAATGTFSGSISGATGAFTGTVNSTLVHGVAMTAGVSGITSQGGVSMSGDCAIGGALNHDGSTYGLCGTTPAAPTTIADLPGSPTLAQVASKLNNLMGNLRAKGVVG